VDYSAVLCTARGAIYVDLYEEQAPITVNSFVFLAQQGYYNNTTFHRVLPGFMMQGGDPEGTGSGGPGYEFVNESSEDLTFNKPGVMAMANAGADTNGSQFFITFVPTPFLDGGYTIFGQVVEGMNVVEQIEFRDPDSGPTYEGDALQTVVIVDDPASVQATPDEAPTLDHFQTLLKDQVADVFNTLFVLNEGDSHVYSPEEEAASWQDEGGDALVEFVSTYNEEHGFVGTAAVALSIEECPTDPADMPLWVLGFQVSEYGSSEMAEQVVTDDERANQFVESGAYGAFSDGPDTDGDGTADGRVFSGGFPLDGGCTPNGQAYHYEMSAGRYVLSVDTVADGDIVNEASDPTVNDFLAYMMNDLLVKPLSGALTRANSD
jgi:cyclophilin family peptidyl-prolyl cis-trans isomerase